MVHLIVVERDNKNPNVQSNGRDPNFALSCNDTAYFYVQLEKNEHWDFIQAGEFIQGISPYFLVANDLPEEQYYVFLFQDYSGRYLGSMTYDRSALEGVDVNRFTNDKALGGARLISLSEHGKAQADKLCSAKVRPQEFCSHISE